MIGFLQIPITVQAASFSNGSFEIGTNFGATLYRGSTDITNWVVCFGSLPSLASIDYYGGWLASDGSRSLDLNGVADGGICQTFDTNVGREYIVLFDMAGNPDNQDSNQTIKRMGVRAANNIQDYEFDVTGKNGLDMGWQEMSFTFTANEASTMLAFVSFSGGAYGPALDNVRVIEVPLPTLSCVGFEPPMDQPVSVKRNRALPLKAVLLDDQGRHVTDLDLQSKPVVQVTYSPGTGTAVDVTSEVLPAGQSSDGNQFQFIEGVWQFNLLTKNYSAPGIYTITMVPGNSYLIQPACTAGFIVK